MLNQKNCYFEIEGVPRRKMLRKQRSYIGVYADHIEIELDGEREHIALEDIYDIYIQEPLTEDVDCRTTVVEYIEEGEQAWYELEDDTFPALASQMERVLKLEWAHFADKRRYPKTVRWFLACCLPQYVSAGQNPEIFGSGYKIPETMEGQRKVLYESWGINNNQDLVKMLKSLLKGRGDNRAWDLQRLILLSSFGYVCDYLKYEDALDWCLEAALKLQGLYHSWDEFMAQYLEGYCDWADDDIEDEDSEGFQRKRIYEFYRNKFDSPYSISWDMPLSAEWRG